MRKTRRSPGRSRRTPSALPPVRERGSRSAVRAARAKAPPKAPGSGVAGAAAAAPPSLALGAQRQRWLQFQKRQRLSCEEAAKLLLDTLALELGRVHRLDLHAWIQGRRAVCLRHPWDSRSEYQGLVKHTGGCHCGAVRFEVWASDNLHVFDCNCSICVKKQNRHFIVPASHFKLLKRTFPGSKRSRPSNWFGNLGYSLGKGADHLTTYTFNTHSAQHTFCKTCGVQSFYTPRSNPDGYGIAPHCLDEGTITKITVEPINGKEWEKAVKGHPTIRNMSKP